jgi:ABC-type phosphate/phosphonate transport system permease subunit
MIKKGLEKMKKSYKIAICGMTIAALFAVCVVSVFASNETSSYATGSTSAAVTLKPSNAGYVLQGVYAKSDKAASLIKIYGVGGAGRVPVTATATNAATVITCVNTSYALTNADIVVYSYADGSFAKNIISAATPTNVTLTTAITRAAKTSDVIYEMTQDFQMACGSNTVSQFDAAIYYTPQKSPLYVVLDGTSACTLGITAKDQED